MLVLSFMIEVIIFLGGRKVYVETIILTPISLYKALIICSFQSRGPNFPIKRVRVDLLAVSIRNSVKVAMNGTKL